MMIILVFVYDKEEAKDPWNTRSLSAPSLISKVSDNYLLISFVLSI